MRDKTARLQLSRPQAGDQDQPGSALDFDAGY